MSSLHARTADFDRNYAPFEPAVAARISEIQQAVSADLVSHNDGRLGLYILRQLRAARCGSFITHLTDKAIAERFGIDPRTVLRIKLRLKAALGWFGWYKCRTGNCYVMHFDGTMENTQESSTVRTRESDRKTVSKRKVLMIKGKGREVKVMETAEPEIDDVVIDDQADLADCTGPPIGKLPPDLAPAPTDGDDDDDLFDHDDDDAGGNYDDDDDLGEPHELDADEGWRQRAGFLASIGDAFGEPARF